MQGDSASGSLRNSLKNSNLPVSKVRQCLHSETSNTIFTLATRKIKRMKTFARFEKEVWCFDVAYVDKQAKVKDGVKYLLVRQDVFDRTVLAKGTKTKDSEGKVRDYKNRINPSKNFVSKRGQNLLQCLEFFARLKEFKFAL